MSNEYVRAVRKARERIACAQEVYDRLITSQINTAQHKLERAEHDLQMLQAAIEESESTIRSEIADATKGTTGLIDTFGGLTLYIDRITDGKRTLRIDSGIQAAVETSGDLFVTADTHTSSTPSLISVAVGTAIAGPLGGLVGLGNRLIRTETFSEDQDTRTVHVIVAGEEGYISGWDYVEDELDELEARQFVLRILNAAVDYPNVLSENNARVKTLKRELRDIQDGRKRAGELATLTNAVRLAESELALVKAKGTSEDKILLKELNAARFTLAHIEAHGSEADRKRLVWSDKWSVYFAMFVLVITVLVFFVAWIYAT